MNHVISKIEINSFRSLQRVTIDAGNTNVFSGLNDVGKSNVLKALNLFFNGQTDFGIKLNFNADYSKVSLASAQRSSKKKQQIKIKVYLNAPSSFKSLHGKELWVEKILDRFGNPTEHSSLDGKKEKPALTRLLNNIQYFYIPALKGPDVMQYVLGEIGKRKLISESDIADLNKKVNKSIIDLAQILTNSSIQTTTKFELPVLVEDFWQKLNINTKYDEFDKLDREINPSKKGNSEPLKEEFYQVALQLRGEGVKSKYIPPLLQWVQEQESNRQYVWGIDEPENSLEFKKAQEVANLYFGNYSQKTQLFLTSHSLAFIFPNKPYEGINIFRCVRGKFGETKIELLQNLFQEQDKRNLAEEIGALEIQKEVIEEWRLKDDLLGELKEKLRLLTRPVVFVEGELDQVYLKKALDVYDKAAAFPAEIKWIGHKDENGQALFAGKDNMEKAEKFLAANIPPQKTVLFYDVDCNKRVTAKNNLIIYCPEKIPDAKYKTGIEHLLIVPDDFDTASDDYVETIKNGDRIVRSPNKNAIKEHLFNLPKNKQKEWLAKLNEVLEKIEKLICYDQKT